MQRVPLTVVASVVLFVSASSPLEAADIAAEITVSPNVINIASSSTVVTVHTDLPYSLVDGATVTLGSVSIAWWKSDNQGFFVAKFVAEEVKGKVEAGTTATLVLWGVTKLGDAFSGTDCVDVIDVKGKK